MGSHSAMKLVPRVFALIMFALGSTHALAQTVTIPRGGLVFSDRGISGFLTGPDRRNIHAKTET
jgi:hypothetical protein